LIDKLLNGCVYPLSFPISEISEIIMPALIAHCSGTRHGYS